MTSVIRSIRIKAGLVAIVFAMASMVVLSMELSRPREALAATEISACEDGALSGADHRLGVGTIALTMAVDDGDLHQINPRHTSCHSRFIGYRTVTVHRCARFGPYLDTRGRPVCTYWQLVSYSRIPRYETVCGQPPY